MPSIPMLLQHSNNDEREEIELARRWLGSCLAEHQQCRARQKSSTTSSNRILPTRLIQITYSSHSIESIRLVSRPESESLVTAYLTFSHCWGGADIVKLKLEKLARFHESIPLDILPKSFVDAIKVTILLGYEFLWIDSLCIIQNSAEDWQQEAKSMGSVYRNSTLTIAAVGAKDSQGGLFLASRYTRPRVTSQWAADEDMEMRLMETNERERQEPLLRRAWVLQEECLSIRTLNFSSRAVSWDCLGMRASPWDTLRPNMSLASLKLTFDCLQRAKHGWIMYWWPLISDYTGRSATFSADRWEAIRGLAGEVERTRGEKLLHGMWPYRMEYELLWTSEGTGHQRLRIGAPSWSWLSITGAVELHPHYVIPGDVNEIDATIQAPKYPDGFAFISEIRPYLAVSARMSPITIEVSDFTKYGNKCRFEFDNNSNDERDLSGGDCIMDTSEVTHAAYALQLLRRTARSHESHGLVVVADQEDDPLWRRVGMYVSLTDEPFKERFDIILV